VLASDVVFLGVHMKQHIKDCLEAYEVQIWGVGLSAHHFSQHSLLFLVLEWLVGHRRLARTAGKCPLFF